MLLLGFLTTMYGVIYHKVHKEKLQGTLGWLSIFEIYLPIIIFSLCVPCENLCAPCGEEYYIIHPAMRQANTINGAGNLENCSVRKVSMMTEILAKTIAML